MQDRPEHLQPSNLDRAVVAAFPGWDKDASKGPASVRTGELVDDEGDLDGGPVPPQRRHLHDRTKDAGLAGDLQAAEPGQVCLSEFGGDEDGETLADQSGRFPSEQFPTRLVDEDDPVGVVGDDGRHRRLLEALELLGRQASGDPRGSSGAGSSQACGGKPAPCSAIWLYSQWRHTAISGNAGAVRSRPSRARVSA